MTPGSEPTVFSKLFLDAIVVEDRQSDGSLPDSPRTDKSDRDEVLYETDDLLGEFFTSETGSRWWGR